MWGKKVFEKCEHGKCKNFLWKSPIQTRPLCALVGDYNLE